MPFAIIDPFGPTRICSPLPQRCQPVGFRACLPCDFAGPCSVVLLDCGDGHCPTNPSFCHGCGSPFHCDCQPPDGVINLVCPLDDETAIITECSKTSLYRFSGGNIVANLRYRCRNFTFTSTLVAKYKVRVSSSDFVPFITVVRTDTGERFQKTGSPAVLTFDVPTVGKNYKIEVTTFDPYKLGEFDIQLCCNCLNCTITTSSPLPDANLAMPYTTTLVATPTGTHPSWSVTTGSLPPGLTLASSTGIISGTPTLAGTYHFTIQYTDDDVICTKDFDLTVNGVVLHCPSGDVTGLPTTMRCIEFETLYSMGTFTVAGPNDYRAQDHPFPSVVAGDIATIDCNSMLPIVWSLTVLNNLGAGGATYTKVGADPRGAYTQVSSFPGLFPVPPLSANMS